jgi:hypothetical protein
MKGAWRRIHRKGNRHHGVIRFNPASDLLDTLKKAGSLGLGYASAMVVGSTITEKFLYRLPKLARIVIRGLIGVGVGYAAEYAGRDGEDIKTGSMLYVLSEVARSFLNGRQLPFVKTGLEDVASALPAPAAGATSGLVFDRSFGGIVADQPLPLHRVTPSSRLTPRFMSGRS